MIDWFYPRTDVCFQLSILNYLWKSSFLKIQFSLVVGLPKGFAENDSHSRIPRTEIAMTEHFVENSNPIGP